MEDRIVVVGGGSMGAGIAAVARAASYDVVLVEPDPAARERAGKRAAGVTLAASVPADERVEIAIEAVPERLDLKQAIFATMAAALPKAVLATNTSSLPVSEIAKAAPQRGIGMHFFNPPEKMRLVEIVRTDASARSAVEAARAFVQRIGKTAIVTADTPGFVVNRVARPYYLQSIDALHAGVGSIEALDRLARGIGFRMGPFELMDFIGLDVNLATSESVYERTRARRLRPREMQRALVAQGRLGRKSGAGFYDYGVAPPARDAARPATAQRFPGGVACVADGALRVELEALGARGDDGEPDVVLADAYGFDLEACANGIRNPQRLVGVGIVGALADQRAVEIVALERTSSGALALARDAFERLGRDPIDVANVPGLFLGRVVAAIVNEARIAVREGVAGEEDVDSAMRLGTNYPHGPIAWGKSIGQERVAEILRVTDMSG
ncbi:MAG: FAD-dependent oxidoreductase [Candidatus Tyrphobacter sp.]